MIPVSQAHLLTLVFALVIGWILVFQLWSALRQEKRYRKELFEENREYDWLLGLIKGEPQYRVNSLYEYSWKVPNPKLGDHARRLAEEFEEALKHIKELQEIVATSESDQELETLRVERELLLRRVNSAERKLQVIRSSL